MVCKPRRACSGLPNFCRIPSIFRTLDIPVRSLECCSGDLADLKVKSMDVEAWYRSAKYFEVGSCSNLGDAQARRLGIRGEEQGEGQLFSATLNNTVVARRVC